MPNATPGLRLLFADSVRVLAGAQRFVLDAAVGLRERGHAVTVQTHRGALLAQRARAVGLPVRELTMRTDAAPWTVLPLARLLRRAPVDAVVTTYDKDLRTAGLAARLCGRRIAVLHSRECDDPLKDRLRYRLFYNRVADHVITNSEATRRTTLASARWLRPERVSVMYKGIDPAVYEHAGGSAWRAKLAVPAGVTVLGFAGQLVERKRCDRLLRVLATSGLQQRPWLLAIAGSGPQEERLRRLAVELGLADRVRFSGFVDPIAPWFAAIDLFVLPSLIEGFGYVLAEAMAAGKPCVSYAASSTPEVVEDGVTGLLAAPGDEAGLGRALARLLDDAQLRAAMGSAARHRVRERFTLQRMIDALEQRILTEVERRRCASSPKEDFA
jgi:glycosyltransferase involved in cell wall biosynthesis